MPVDRLHAPLEFTESEQIRVGVVLGMDYLLPIVDHAWARHRALAAYAEARSKSG